MPRATGYEVRGPTASGTVRCKALPVRWRTWRCDPTTPSVPVPSLPRIKRQRPRVPIREAPPRPEPRIAELNADGLTWIHIDGPTTEEAMLLADRFGWHPLDIEDVLSKRQ